MTEPTLRRPPQATAAGWLVVIASVVVVLTALDQAAGLHSLDTRQTVDDYLSTPPGDELGLGVQGGLILLRVLTTVTAVTAAATAVLGWYALRRSRGARLALTVLAAPLFLVALSFQGLVASGVFPAMVAAAVVILWFQPSRDWYDGRTPAPTPRPAAPPAARDPLLDLPPPTAPPLHPGPYAARPQGPRPAERPRSVLWACVIAWVSTATVFVLFAVSLLEFVVAPDQSIDQVRRQNPDLTMSDADLRLLVIVVCVVAMAWSAAAAGLALLVWRRVGWAAVALGVSAALACLTLLPIVACLAAGVLLLRADARAWLGGRRSRPSAAANM